ncbi:(4Fe-4S)-binding protein [Dehalococcoides mccartyi]|uniref:ATP-binding protein n=1 Tax=Dehalococcoides TaxID=61434 RepID=UPI0005B56AFD|nr:MULTISPECIES: ATP-binding protein [Dehalococcoides]APH13070.1 (4Fe-4S)-binding protein [Dehalococcoides mccartyi]QYY58780.1 ATP-binding protein [Dehalococcoides mccartyi]BAQ35296.1 iron-sulfur binding protein [Dehalococcoides sp. UCH007]
MAKEIVILSGKGGTGKTSLVSSFASIVENAVLVDCDVDAADLHLLVHPEIQVEQPFIYGQTAVIDPQVCNRCGRCQDLCRFNAIGNFRIDTSRCEGCALCFMVCPLQAIQMEPKICGRWFLSDTRYGPMLHARLDTGAGNSGKLVSLLRQTAREVARKADCEFILVDGPPGIGCPVISSLTGADLVIIITEPTLSGIHDLGRVIGICKHFEIPSLVCLNKCDINPGNSQQIEDYCRNQGIKIISYLPFSDVFTEAQLNGVPPIEYTDGNLRELIRNTWVKITKHIEKV